MSTCVQLLDVGKPETEIGLVANFRVAHLGAKSIRSPAPDCCTAPIKREQDFAPVSMIVGPQHVNSRDAGEIDEWSVL